MDVFWDRTNEGGNRSGRDDCRAVSMKQLESAFSELLCYAASFGAAKCFNCLRGYKKTYRGKWTLCARSCWDLKRIVISENGGNNQTEITYRLSPAMTFHESSFISEKREMKLCMSSPIQQQLNFINFLSLHFKYCTISLLTRINLKFGFMRDRIIFFDAFIYPSADDSDAFPGHYRNL